MCDKTKNIIQAIVFSGLILCLSLICLLSPSKQFSEAERRELSQLPEFSLSTLSSGRFMSSFEDYTLDQFPFRDFFRTIKAYTSKYIFSHKSNNDIYVTGYRLQN